MQVFGTLKLLVVLLGPSWLLWGRSGAKKAPKISHQMALNGKNVVVHVFLQNSLAQKLMSGEMARLTRAMNDFFRYHNESITQFGISYDGNSGMNILEDIKPMILKKMPNVKVFNYEKHFPPCFHPLYQCGAPDCDNPEGFISRRQRDEHWESNLDCAMAQFF